MALSTTPDSTSSNAWPARPCQARPLHSLRLTLLRALYCTPSGVRVCACLRPLNLPLAGGSVYVIEIGSNPEIGPTPRPQRGTPFAPRGPGGPFPRFNTNMGRCDFLTVFSPHFVSFAWRYLGASAFRPRSASGARPTDHPGVYCTGCSRSGFFRELSGSPKFPGNPCDHSPCSSDPGVTRQA